MYLPGKDREAYLKANSETPILQEYVAVVTWTNKINEDLGDLFLNTTLGGQGMLEKLGLKGTNRGALMIRAKKFFGERPPEETRKSREQGSGEKISLGRIRELLVVKTSAMLPAQSQSVGLKPSAPSSKKEKTRRQRKGRTRLSRTAKAPDTKPSSSPTIKKEAEAEEIVPELSQRPVMDRPVRHRRFAESELPQDQTGWVSSNKQPSVFKAPNGACQWWLRNSDTNREKPCGAETEDVFCKGHDAEATEYIDARQHFDPGNGDMFAGMRRKRK